MAFHHLLRRHAGMARHLIQVGAIFAAIDHRDIDIAGLWHQTFVTLPSLTQQFQHRLGIGLRRIQQQRQVIHSRHHFPYVSVVIQLFCQCPDALLTLQRHRGCQFKHYSAFP
ncbi:hypothetical protein D3C76_1251430 [compost metagenome]